ncbi:MAG: hypothetical protein WC269_05430, partial [Candidatus Gracilibacteria bacterium]
MFTHHNKKRFFVYLLLSVICSFILPLEQVFAVFTTYESFIVNDLHKVEFIGNTAGGQLGAAVASGDFNNDDIQDLVMGAPFSSTGLSDWNGEVLIFFGRDSFLERSFDLNKISPNIAIYGQSSGDQFGTVITVGDYNHDGFDDLAVSAPNAYSNKIRPGKVYIFYGGKDSLLLNDSSIELSVQRADTEFTGKDDKDSFGLALKTLDMNEDFYDDLLIGSPFATAYEVNHSGAVYGFYGTYKGFNSYVKIGDGLVNIVFYGQKENERFGTSIAGGHLLGYKFPDIMIGAYASTVSGPEGDIENAGKVYVFKGSFAYYSILRVPTFAINGTEKNEWFGFCIASSDIDADGIDDLAITSFPYLKKENSGKIFVFYGGQKFLRENVEFNSLDVKDIVIENPRAEAFLGASVILEDMNKDGVKDIIAGAPGIGNPLSNDAGDVYIAYSNAKELNTNYNISEHRIGSQIHGENADDWFGYVINILDFNNDGYKDLAIGSRYSDTAIGINSGKVFVLLGDGIPFGDQKEILEPKDKPVSRGELVSMVFEKFNLTERKKDYFDDCKKHLEFCLFNFITVSTFDNLKLSPDLILYPDVLPISKYYNNINFGTMLGLLNGYSAEIDSPFHPERNVSRIQALKIIFGAADLVSPKYKFELV